MHTGTLGLVVAALMQTSIVFSPPSPPGTVTGTRDQRTSAG